MSASLVGSEMCIRDRPPHLLPPPGHHLRPERPGQDAPPGGVDHGRCRRCLLYTSDAADDM
eukprot:2309485-Alexandrium_andersonii.AAC.1